MKYFAPLFVLLIVTACQNETKEFSIPESLEDKKALLKEKQTASSLLDNEITALEEAIFEQDDTAQKAGRPVTTSTVERSDFARYVTIQGNVAAEDLYDATGEIAGRIINLNVREGDAVRKGQLIAEIDTEAIESQKTELEISLSLAETVFEKQQNLWNQNIGSEIQFLEAKNTKERLAQSLELLELQLRKTKVYAPSSGIVERVILSAGELASPGMPIVQILDTDKLKLSIAVPESYVGIIRKGQRVMVTVPALDLEKTLPITNVGRTVDPANRTFEVQVNLPANRQLKPNLLAEMKIADLEVKDVISIPMNLVQQEVSGARYVFIANTTADGIFATKKVIEIGETSDGQVIITSGLEGGEKLIEEGARGLADGALIEIVE